MSKILTFEQMAILRHRAYNVAIERKKELDYGSTERKEVELLVSQFYYGIAAQTELAMKCLQYGWLTI